MRKKTVLISSIAALVLILLISFIVLQQNHKPEKVVDRFVDAVKQKNTTILKEIIVPDDKKAVVEKNTLTALVNYLNANHNSFEVIKNSLQKQIKDDNYSDKSEQLYLIKDGKDMGMFPVYKLKAKTVALKISGQNETDKIALHVKGLKDALSKRKKDDAFGPLLPGEYEVETSVKNDLGVFKEKEKKDVWGNPQVTITVDPEKLAHDDDKVRKDIMRTAITFNENLSKFVTSGLKADSFTASTEAFKTAFTDGSEDYFQLIKKGIDELQSQYLGATINEGDMDISYFDGKWEAEVEAIVKYNEKVKIKGEKKFEDASYQALRTYSLVYDKVQNKWLIEAIQDTEADGTEPDYWEKKQEMKVKNPPVLKWTEKGNAI
ncbi:hypothetical protein P5G51_004960 [Virgibacillus sp. 179-BFC.A HS]|uniref:Uncharacterized protein n=1 Tax=Tigheibacillus jepli TaxID=3035914 RepID=A0ABU5CEW8_9BACI|nr:hypothetical protein [Virgibacillus sp. 179-BFC.A HS]MDY0404836.1 hypothetical protein [Virgibacillus sp. 179-BFC.A HS]